MTIILRGALEVRIPRTLARGPPAVSRTIVRETILLVAVGVLLEWTARRSVVALREL